MTSIARLALVAIDTDRTVELAEFYAAITGFEIRPYDDPGWIQLVADTGATIAFQKVDDYVAPEWPGSEHPQQLHLDFEVEDLDTGEEAVLAIGARKHELQPAADSFRVYLDPSDHPFCLVRA